MITMSAQPWGEYYTRKNLYRADGEGRLMLVLDQKENKTTYEIDGRDLADLRGMGCIETRFDTREDLVHVNEARVKHGLAVETSLLAPPESEVARLSDIEELNRTSPLIPATEEETAAPLGEAVQEPEQEQELPPVVTKPAVSRSKQGGK
jgi:hypothetical protein